MGKNEFECNYVNTPSYGARGNGRRLKYFSVQVIDKIQFQVVVKEKLCQGQKKTLFLNEEMKKTATEPSP